MNKSTYLICLLTALVFSGCAMPTTSVRTVDDRPTLAIKGAPEGAILFVDGLNMGLANQYSGTLSKSYPDTRMATQYSGSSTSNGGSTGADNTPVLLVEPGTHVVRITVGNTTIYEQKIFVESSLKTITIR